MITKWRPLLRTMPAAALTAGGWVQVCSSFTIRNRDPGSNGALIDAGGAVALGSDYGSIPVNPPSGPPPAPACSGSIQASCTGSGLCLQTFEGTPFQNAIVSNDASLSSDSSRSEALFTAVFGTPLAHYRAHAYVIDTGSAAGNATALINAYAANIRAFWIEGDLQFSGNYNVGSSDRPVMIASSGDLTFNGSGGIHGVVYSNHASWNANGTGPTHVHGAVITRANYAGQGNGSILYDAAVLQVLRNDTGILLRLPGSWRDF